MDDDNELCQRLLLALRGVTATPSLEFAGQPVRLHGGFWADLFAFRLNGATDDWDRELVARVMPDAGLAAKETIIQGGGRGRRLSHARGARRRADRIAVSVGPSW